MSVKQGTQGQHNELKSLCGHQGEPLNLLERRGMLQGQERASCRVVREIIRKGDGRLAKRADAHRPRMRDL